MSILSPLSASFCVCLAGEKKNRLYEIASERRNVEKALKVHIENGKTMLPNDGPSAAWTNYLIALKDKEKALAVEEIHLLYAQGQSATENASVTAPVGSPASNPSSAAGLTPFPPTGGFTFGAPIPRSSLLGSAPLRASPAQGGGFTFGGATANTSNDTVRRGDLFSDCDMEHIYEQLGYGGKNVSEALQAIKDVGTAKNLLKKLIQEGFPRNKKHFNKYEGDTNDIDASGTLCKMKAKLDHLLVKGPLLNEMERQRDENELLKETMRLTGHS